MYVKKCKVSQKRKKFFVIYILIMDRPTISLPQTVKKNWDTLIKVPVFSYLVRQYEEETNFIMRYSDHKIKFDHETGLSLNLDNSPQKHFNIWKQDAEKHIVKSYQESYRGNVRGPASKRNFLSGYAKCLLGRASYVYSSLSQRYFKSRIKY